MTDNIVHSHTTYECHYGWLLTCVLRYHVQLNILMDLRTLSLESAHYNPLHVQLELANCE